jgi:heat shock protein HtpX
VILTALTVALFAAWPVLVFGVLGLRVTGFTRNILLAVVFAILFSGFMIMRYLRAQITTLERGSDLAHAVEEVMILAGLRRMPEVGLVQSDAANALIVGGVLDRPLLAVTSGLVRGLTRDQLRGVLAHEAAHLGGPDQPMRMVGVALTNWLVWLLTPRIEPRRVLFIGAIAIVLILAPLTGLAVFGGPLFIALVETRISRHREHVADARAVLMTRDPSALADALERLQGDVSPSAWTTDQSDRRAAWLIGALATTQVDSGVPSWLARLFDPHPSVRDRVRRLRSMA